MNLQLQAKSRLLAAPSKRAFKELTTKLSTLFGLQPKLVWQEAPFYVIWDGVCPSTSAHKGSTIQQFMTEAEFTKKVTSTLGCAPSEFSKPHRILGWKGPGWTACWNGHNRGFELNCDPEKWA